MRRHRRRDLGRGSNGRHSGGGEVAAGRNGRARGIRLDRSAELELIRRWQEERDRLARDVLVKDHQPLVSAIARSYWRYWADVDDLQQEGNLGLLEAIDRFDRSRGTRLAAYARPWIRAAILRFLVDNVRLVRVGRTRGERRIFFGINDAERLLGAQGAEPTPEALAARLGADPAEVESMAWRLGHTDLSIDESLDAVPQALTTNGVESRAAQSELCATVRHVAGEVLASLEPRQAEILRARLLEPESCTLQELGDRFGVTRERIRQIEETSLKRLRARLRDRLPDPDLWAGISEERRWQRLRQRAEPTGASDGNREREPMPRPPG